MWVGVRERACCAWRIGTGETLLRYKVLHYTQPQQRECLQLSTAMRASERSYAGAIKIDKEKKNT